MHPSAANLVKPNLDLQCLWEAHGVQILATRWAANKHRVKRTGHTDCFVVEVMVSGTFEKRSNHGMGMADANVAMRFAPGEHFEIDHFCGESNAGITIRIEPTEIGRWLPFATHDLNGISRRSMTRLVSPPAALGIQCLASYLSSQYLNRPDPSFVACRLRRCLGQLMAVSHENPLNHRIERVECVRQFLNLNFSSPVRRSELARSVDCSPWLLSREFRRQVGISMHAYLNSLRLRAGLRAILDGCNNLTSLALGLGFGSHSHFSASFKAEFGLSPRNVRDRVRRSSSEPWHESSQNPHC